MKNTIKTLLFTLLVFMIVVFAANCSNYVPGGDGNIFSSISDASADASDNEDNENGDIIWVPWLEEEGPPPEGCVECKWYFCPPLDAIWQKEICLNMCDNPPTLHFEGECEEFMECDPSQYHIDFLECTTDEGYAGVVEKICNKGKIQYTDCITECIEETCDYIDNDCDGEIDEGVLNACNDCEEIPEET